MDSYKYNCKVYIILVRIIFEHLNYNKRMTIERVMMLPFFHMILLFVNLVIYYIFSNQSIIEDSDKE